MYDIRHRVGVEAPLATIYNHLATVDGLREWWTTDVSGTSNVGDKLTFHFGGPDRFFTMEVLALGLDHRVAWRCVDGPDEWSDTTITFALREIDGETIVNFTHSGWREPVEFMGHCSSKWGSYLLSLKQSVESGSGFPYPNDVKMSRFDSPHARTASAGSVTLLAAMDQPIDDLFKALADPGRRRLLDSLNVRNGQNLTDLCSVMAMTRQSVTKHLEILEAANLIVVVRQGRERLHYLNAAPIHDIADRWIGRYHRERVRAIADLKDALELSNMPVTTTTPTTATQSFAYTTYIKATPEQLWNGLTDPAFTRRYWDMEFVTDWAAGSPMTWIHQGVVLDDPAQIVIESNPYTRLSYTWHTITGEFAEHIGLDEDVTVKLVDETQRHRSKATFEIEDLGGKCKLTVIHDDFPPDSTMLTMISGGWPAVISSLKTLLETGQLLEDPA